MREEIETKGVQERKREREERRRERWKKIKIEERRETHHVEVEHLVTDQVSVSLYQISRKVCSCAIIRWMNLLFWVESKVDRLYEGMRQRIG